jgi:hypothetical protein
VNPLAGKHMVLDQLMERHQHRRAGADVIRHGRERYLDALARILLALAIERLMIGVFFDQDHRQQARPGKSSRDHMEGRRRLRDFLARPAAELLAHVLGDEPLSRDHIERLGDVFADLRELGTAAAGARRRCRMDNPPTRQVIGKVPPRTVAPREALNLDVCGRGFGRFFPGRCGQFLKLQLHLIDQTLAALGSRAKSLALHLGNHQLKMLDHRLRTRELGARFDQRCFERFYIVGKLVRGRRHGGNCTTIDVIRRSKISNVSQHVALSGRRWPPGVLWSPPIDAFKQIAELGRRDHHRAVGRRRPDETAAL